VSSPLLLSPSALKVYHGFQRLNPVLECIRNVGKEFGDIVSDFQVGRTTGVLFLRYVRLLIDLLFGGTETRKCSLKYHRLHPEYIHKRIEGLGHAYNLRILLLMCDVVSNEILCSISDI
jgi:DNA excision repair protein ERCC-1